MNMDRLRGRLEFGADTLVLKKRFLGFGMVAKRRHCQTTGSPLTIFSQLMRVDRLHGLLEFGADPVSTKKIYLHLVWLQRGAITKRRVHRQAHSAS
jgi:hypothetical protein